MLIFKSGDNADILNYTFISIISTLPKLMSSIPVDKLIAFFVSKVISQQQGIHQQ